MQPSTLFRSLLLAGLCSAASLPAFADAQTERIDALEKRLERSNQLVEKLAARIAELERPAKTAAAPAATPVVAAVAAAPAATAQAAEIAALKETVNQISAGLNSKGGDNGVALHGFGDVGAGWSRGDDPTKLRGFNAGTLDFYLTPQFSERTKALIEFAIEYGDDGHAALDLERLQLGYTVNDSLTLWLGRYHTPIGLWNTSYHHGANLQTSITRPRFIDFEDKGGIVPAHSVGAWASGKTAMAGGKLSYDVYVANGPSISDRTLDFRAFNDDTSNKMVGVNLAYLPGGALRGLTLGVHAFASKVNTFDLAGDTLSTTKLRMAGAYAGYDENDWEAIAEYYRFSNSDAAGGGSHSSSAWFAQVGKTFGELTPFVRFENASLNANDNFFRSQSSGRSYKRTGVGLRYALDAKSSLKAEFASTRENAIDQLDENGASAPFSARSYKRLAVQYSVSF